MNDKTPFEIAKNEYFEKFGEGYPCAIGFGYPAETDEENIKIIYECIKKGTPCDFKPPYEEGLLY